MNVISYSIHTHQKAETKSSLQMWAKDSKILWFHVCRIEDKGDSYFPHLYKVPDSLLDWWWPPIDKIREQGTTQPSYYNSDRATLQICPVLT